MKFVSGEEIPGIQHHLANESEELRESSSSTRKRSWETPDPNVKVVALSPAELQNCEAFICDNCDKGFPRMQNLQFHLLKHNIPYKLPEKDATEVARKKVYICPDSSCIHHNPARALSNITAVKRHYHRKHMEKSFICNKCSHKYAWKSDLDAHKKKCGTRNYECGRCGLKCSRIDRFEIHKAKCQIQGPVSNELVHISKSVYKVNDVQVPAEPGPSSTLSDIFETEQVQPIDQMSDSSQHHSFHADYCREESMSKVNDVQVPAKPPSSTLSNIFETEQVQPIDQMSDSFPQYSLHADYCREKSMSEVNDVQVPAEPPSSTLFDIFETEQLQPINQVLDSSQQQSFRADYYRKSIWELTFWDPI